MVSVTYYYSNKNHDESLKDLVMNLCESDGFNLHEICIDGDSFLEERYASNAPVIIIGPYQISSPFTETEVTAALRAVKEKTEFKMDYIEKRHPTGLTSNEKFSLWFAKYYVWVITGIILLFIIGAFLPPLFMLSGNQDSAKPFYKFYSLLCHQLFFRSFFIGGEQLFYPRELAGLTTYKTFEAVTGASAEDLLVARNFLGNEKLGYKIALCQRDIAIYIALAIFGIGFQVSRRKLRPIKWYVWFIVALIPIGLDGFSQLPGLAEGWPAWLPIRESTPLLRIITGVLFGAGTGWYMYPLMEEGMKETRQQLERKKRLIQKIAGKT